MAARFLHQYEAASGKKIVINELKALARAYPGSGAVIRQTAQRVMAGTSTPREHKQLPGTQGLHEIRCTHNGMEFRVLFAYVNRDGVEGVILLALRSFRKTTRALPQGDIDLAQRRLADYRLRFCV